MADLAHLLKRRRDQKIQAQILAHFDSFVRDLAERVVRREWRLDLDVGDMIQEGHLAVIAATREYSEARDGDDFAAYVQAKTQEALNQHVREARREITVRAGRSGLRLDAARFDDSDQTGHDTIASPESERDVYEQRADIVTREAVASEREDEQRDLGKFVRWLPPLERAIIELHFAGKATAEIAKHPSVVALHGHPPLARKVQRLLGLARRKLLGYQVADIQQEESGRLRDEDDGELLAARELVFSAISTRTKAGLELRDYQALAVAAAFRDWTVRGARSTLYVCPTGGGKSLVFIKVVEAFVALMRQQGRPAHVLVLSNQILLCEQIASAFEVHSGLSLGVEQEKKRVDADALPDVTCGTVQTLEDAERRGRFAPDAFGLIVVDEADLSITPSYQRILAHFPESLRFGCTATPNRSDRVPLRLVFDSVCHRVDLHDLVQRGHAPPVRRRLVRIESVRFKGAPLRFGDFTDEWLEKVLTEERALHEVAVPTMELAEDRPTLVFAATVPHAVALAAMFNRYRPGCAAVVHGRMSKRQQKVMIERFAAREFQFLVNCQIVGRGLDLPFVSCIAMARPTYSRTRYAQALGRGLRAFKDKRNLFVLDFTDNSLLHRLVTAVDVLAGTRDPAVIFRAKQRDGDIADLVREAAAVVQATEQRAAALAEVYYETFTVRNDQLDSIDWDAQSLGKMPDNRIAAILGCTEEDVRRERVKRGIMAWGARLKVGEFRAFGAETDESALAQHFRRSLISVAKEIRSEGAALQLLSTLRWPLGPQCPSCSSKATTVEESAACLRCNACGDTFLPTRGTFMDGLPVSLRQWAVALHLFVDMPLGEVPEKLVEMCTFERAAAEVAVDRLREQRGYLS